MPANSDKQWFYAQNRQKFGPVTAQVLAQMYAQGDLHDNDLVWAPHMEKWQKVEAVNDQFENAPPPPPPQPEAAPSAYASPVDPLPMAQPVATGRVVMDDSFENGGFFSRFAAMIIDFIILIPIMGIIQFITATFLGEPKTESAEFAAGMVLLLVTVGTQWLYFAFQESSSYGATFGKRALGLAVTDLTGDGITFVRATVRHFSKIISGMMCLMGYFFVFFTERKQALHDIIAGCMIIK